MKKENNVIAITSILAGIVLVIALVVLFMYGGNGTSQNVVTVQGMSTVKVIPDIISVQFSIETKGNTSSEANDKNSEIYEDLITALILEGFSRSEIGTESYNIYPNTQWDDGNMKTEGFIATRSIKVEISTNESSALTSIVDSGIDAGAGINFINFELSQELQNEYKSEALELASKDARNKAEAVVRGFGKKVGKLIAVSVSDYGYSPWIMYSGDVNDYSSAKIAAENITPSAQDIFASVTAIYKIA